MDRFFVDVFDGIAVRGLVALLEVSEIFKQSTLFRPKNISGRPWVYTCLGTSRVGDVRGPLD